MLNNENGNGNGNSNDGGFKKYNNRIHPQMAKWMARNGLTDKEIADEFGIDVRTLYRWRKKFPDFKQGLLDGKNFVDSLVEDSLLKRALGFEVEEVKTYIVENEGGKHQKKVEKNKKYVLPDTLAQIFWLKNRQPKNWREKVEVEGGNENNPLLLELTQAIKDANAKYSGANEDDDDII